MKSNPSKCYSLVSSCEKIKMEIRDFKKENRIREQLLGVHIDNRLAFDYLMSELCKKASKKVNALARVSWYINLSKRKISTSAFFDSPLNYYPLTWMCYSRTNIRKIDRLRETCLWIIYNDRSYHLRSCLKMIALFLFIKQMYKFWLLKCVRRSAITLNFWSKEWTSLKSMTKLSIFLVFIKVSILRSPCYLGPKVWDILPNILKYRDGLYKFKKAIKKWKPENCPCRTCEKYTLQLLILYGNNAWIIY